LQPGAQPRPPAAMDHQPVRGDQQNLEEHEEVEDVAGEKRADEPHDLELEQRVKVLSARIPAGGHGMGQNNQRKQRGEQHHHRREPVEHQHDTEGRGPVAQPVDKGFAPGGGERQPGGDRHDQRGPGERGDPRHRDIVTHHEADHRREQRGQDDGGNDPVAHRGASVGSSSPSGASSLVLIRSSPDSTKAPSATITRTAVIPKEITIAVSTSACGSGSV